MFLQDPGIVAWFLRSVEHTSHDQPFVARWIANHNNITESPMDPDSIKFPKVSVVVPTYNRAKILPRALDSVVAQTFTNFELIVVDDHSSDTTHRVVAKYADDARVRALRHDRNRGQSCALNTGISAARGEYIAFLDDDDEWVPSKLALQVEVLDAASSKVALVYGWRQDIDERYQSRRTVRQTLRGDIFEQMLALETPVPPSAWLVRTPVARAIGGFDENVLANDVDFACRLSQQGWHFDYVPNVVLLKYRHSGGQMVDETPENLSRRAAFIRRHLARFAAELDERPEARAGVYRRLARYEFRYHPFRGLLSLARAFLTDPARLTARAGFYARQIYYLSRDATRRP